MRTAPRRICLLVTQLERGGAQKIVLRLAAHFQARGDTVTVAFFYDKAGLLPELRQESMFELVDLGARPAGARHIARLWQPVAALGRLYRLLRRQQTELLLTFTHYSNLLGPPIGWLARVPLRLASARSLLADRPAWFRRLHGLVLASGTVHHLIAISRPVRALYVEPGWVPEAKVTIIPNGVDLARYRQGPAHVTQPGLALPAGAFVILTVARLEQQKGHHVLLASARELCHTHRQLHFVWLGDGPEMARLQAAVAAAGLAGQVHLVGASAAVPAWLARADLFVLPSLAEGMPNALLEALAAGVPAIASAVGGVLDVLEGSEA
ncbi:MAG: glycosyltransferase, partial [Anaerolineales bacterium]|nr:glycosyltransferase [Anaerolineales bacterium]